MPKRRYFIALAGLPSPLHQGLQAQTFSRRKVNTREQHLVLRSSLKNIMYTGLLNSKHVLNTCFNFALLLPAFGQCSSVCTRSSQLIFDASCFFLLEFKLRWRLQVSFCFFLQKLYKKKGEDQVCNIVPLTLG